MEDNFIKNQEFYQKYIDFITEHEVKDKKIKGCERHHIKPRILYPELIKDKSNIVRLTAHDHLIAHYLLYKAYDNPPMTLALNMMINRGKYNPFFNMNSVDELFNQYADDYAEFRRKVCEAIRDANTGRLVSEKERLAISRRTKGKVVTKDKDGNIVYTSVDDERYKSGELVYYRVGYHHTEETKKKMSDNGLKSRKAYTDGNVTVYSYIPIEGMWEGLADHQKQHQSETITNMGFAFNESTGQTIRCYKDKPLPEGFIWKREKKGDFVGWDNLNKDYVRVFNIKTKYYGMRKKNEIDWDNEILMGGINPNTKIAVFDNFLFYRLNDLNDYMKENYDKTFIPDKMATTMNIFTQNYDTYIINSKTSRYNNIAKFNGKMFKDIFQMTIKKICDIEEGDFKIYHSDKTRQKYGDRI